MKFTYFFSSELLETFSWLFSTPFWHSLNFLEKKLERFPLGTILSPVKQVYLENEDTIFIGKKCLIEPGATIKGPCVIENGCHVLQSAYVRKGCYIGPGCTIGHGTEIKSSILLEGVKAAHWAYIGDSIVGKHVQFGAGVKCANLRLDQQEVYLRVLGKTYSTGKKKFGSIIGDFTRIGCNCVLNPGSCIFQNQTIAPLQQVKGTWNVERKQCLS